jgi:hypothetical protein
LQREVFPLILPLNLPLIVSEVDGRSRRIRDGPAAGSMRLMRMVSRHASAAAWKRQVRLAKAAIPASPSQSQIDTTSSRTSGNGCATPPRFAPVFARRAMIAPRSPPHFELKA